MKTDTKQIRRFKGLNNVTDPMRLGLGWLARADNLDITDTGALQRREGFATALAGAFTGAFATQDGLRMYAVDGGDLKEVFADMSTRTLASVGTAPMQWVEVNGDVYYTNGTASGIVRAGGELDVWQWPVPGTPRLAAREGRLPAGAYRVACTYLLPDGRETAAGLDAEIVLAAGQSIAIEAIPSQPGLRTLVYIAPANSTVFQFAFEAAGANGNWNDAPGALGMDLLYRADSPLPGGISQLALWRGCIYAGQYDPASNTTVVWISRPLGFHLFDLARDFIAVPGRVAMLAAHEDALIVGTDAAIHAYDGEKLRLLAPYGAVSGWGHVTDEDDGKVLFWTTRGLCSALPFVNLTSRQISVAPGVQAGAAIVQKDGAKRYVVSLVKGGTAFNPRA